MIEVDPAVAPFTIPDNEPTEAIRGLAVVQVPEPVFDNVIVDPAQTRSGPEIAGGKGLTVTTIVAAQPNTK